mgnify:CR=1 FL=1|tara:strand:- start:121 stop:552 length:432 start_codon:yes stop_codon:yes gene_type:complete
MAKKTVSSETTSSIDRIVEILHERKITAHDFSITARVGNERTRVGRRDNASYNDVIDFLYEFLQPAVDAGVEMTLKRSCRSYISGVGFYLLGRDEVIENNTLKIEAEVPFASIGGKQVTLPLSVRISYQSYEGNLISMPADIS